MFEDKVKFSPMVLATAFILALSWFTSAYSSYLNNMMSAAIVFLILSIFFLVLGMWGISRNKKRNRKE